MKLSYSAFVVLVVLGCGAHSPDGPLEQELLELPVQAAAPCIKVTCDQATCAGTLTVNQTVPTTTTGKVEVWAADQWTSTGWRNFAPVTTVTQSPGSVVTVTPGVSFRQNEYFCLLTSVVTRNAAGEILGSTPVVSDGAGGVKLALQPSAVTATVAP